MKTRINIVEEWALALLNGEPVYKTVNIGYRVDEWDDSFEPSYCRLSMTFASRPDAERFAKSLGGLARPT